MWIPYSEKQPQKGQQIVAFHPDWRSSENPNGVILIMADDLNPNDGSYPLLWMLVQLGMSIKVRDNNAVKELLDPVELFFSYTINLDQEYCIADMYERMCGSSKFLKKHLSRAKMLNRLKFYCQSRGLTEKFTTNLGIRCISISKSIDAS